MGIDAGSTGPLMAMLFMGVAGAVGDASEVDAKLISTMLGSGLTQLQTITKAKVGDKTMMDALVPGVEALAAAVADGDDLEAALAKAASAAEAGAEKTEQMQARFGRAKNLGERSVGHRDPGATSMSIMIRGLAEGVAAV
jgi:dihydroxyacetone kinase-like protein